MIIIDGHNLIGKIPHLKLSDPNSKNKLLELLDKYEHIMDVKIIVVFDGNTFGDYEREDYKNIEVRYPEKDKTADDVIIDIIDKNRGLTIIRIVSSDNKIISSARKAHMPVQSSYQFFEEIENVLTNQNEKTEEYLNPQDVNEWVKYFKNK